MLEELTLKSEEAVKEKNDTGTYQESPHALPSLTLDTIILKVR